MKKKRIFPSVLAFAMLLSACTGIPFSPSTPTTAPTTEATTTQASDATTEAVTEAPTEVTTETTLPTEPLDAAQQLLSEMTLREKVGQLFIIRPDSLDLSLSQEQINDASATGVTKLTDAMRQTLQDYPVGGIIQFGKNIVSPDQITAFNEALQSASDIPLFLCIDEEGGLVARLANHKAFDLPKYKNAASIQTVADAQEMGRTIGTYLLKYGFTLDFAPVADVNTNPDNPIIGTRAFSSDPQTAAELASAMASGLKDAGICAVFKHFPGHGDTAEDSHSGIAVTYKTAAEMRECEWIPFSAASSDDCVMVGHIATPAITGDLTPATLSHTLVTEILKEELGFTGLVITDSLAMGAITESYTAGEAALAALEAGCDILLMPNGLTEAFDAIVSAVENGTYSEDALNATVLRILRYKQSHDLLP